MAEESDHKLAEAVMVGNYVKMEIEAKSRDIKSKVSKLFWHGDSAYDAWFSCASNQGGSGVVDAAKLILSTGNAISSLGDFPVAVGRGLRP
ncbi:hypothetical protein OROMI_023128 [Orobanche minor]